MTFEVALSHGIENNKKQTAMIEKKQEKQSGKDICVEMLSGAVAALAYTDEEIRDTLPPEDAQEFIALRNRTLASLENDSHTYGPDEESNLTMAAEEDAPYGD